MADCPVVVLSMWRFPMSPARSGAGGGNVLPDAYVRSVLTKYELPSGEGSPAERVAVELRKPIGEWAGRYLLGVTFCGSYANGTRVKGSTDLDLLISLGPRTPIDIDKLYERFFAFLKMRDYNPKRESVSIGLQHHGLAVDLVPAKQEWGASNDYRIFETERRRIIRTNFDTHQKTVKESDFIEEIRLLKIWRNLRNLRFPSFCLGLTVIDALRHTAHHQPAKNLQTVLEYLRDVFVNAPIRDPANFDNRVSDDLLKHEKLAIADAATSSLRAADWSLIVK